MQDRTNDTQPANQYDDAAGFAGYDDLEPSKLIKPRVVLEKLDDEAGFAGYDDAR
ncbi:hypothetical protein [Xylanimonas ulmi]|uniref:Uncharacterized protein n=1 Tax=Xylanimonas ulmi TaxID=228973 RepID=A0A4Q7M406_9MICO|nr:hypothetical protein [Xylanibacterium ulmi]RZS61362.1 hypothetical protein EV386_1661 [Xylanibacterium ulmi]